MAYRRNSNRRMFVWARSSGSLVAGEGATPPTGGVDLLQSVRERYGGAEFRGATVVTVKGYLKPDDQGVGGGFTGRTAMRVGPEGDPNVAPADIGRMGPGAPGVGLQEDSSPEYDWMGWFPHAITEGDASPPASWNRAASPWGIDLQSARRMEELGQSLLMFYSSGTAGTAVLYDLSIGIKLS